MTGKRVDANQGEIVDALRAVGASVQDLHELGRGVPDLLVGWRGVNVLMEVKAQGGALNDRETRWHSEWRGQVAVVRSVEEALVELERGSDAESL